MYIRGSRAVQKAIDMGITGSVVDLGCGNGNLTPLLSKIGSVKGIDIIEDPKVEGLDFDSLTIDEFLRDCFYEAMTLEKPTEYKVVNLSHVLEHVYSPIECLDNILQEVNGLEYLIISVPLLKHQIVGGHVNLYNTGLLMYQLVLAGYDCSNISIATINKEICCVLPVERIVSYPKLKHDCGDIELLAQYFPKGYDYQGFNGNIDKINWD